MPKRSKVRREKDLSIIARRYLHGDIQSDIAKDLKISQQMVSRDLKVIRERWLNSSLVDFNEMRARELARIDLVEAEAWAGWERSKRARTKTRMSGDTEQKPSHIVRTTTEEIGDPRFLDEVLKCVDKRCQIFGLDAPVKLTWQDEAARAGVDPSALFNELAGSFVEAIRSGENTTD
jgi:hypothetical protein